MISQAAIILNAAN